MKKISLFIVVVFITLSFNTSSRIDVLIAKEIKAAFTIEAYSKESISISSEVVETLPLKMLPTNFYKVNSNNKMLGYYYIGKAFGKMDYFDFIVIFDENLIVSKIKVLIYREDHGGEVASKRWLKQFNGASTNKTLVYQKDIAAISGATISAKSITNEVNKLLKTVHILHTKKQL